MDRDSREDARSRDQERAAGVTLFRGALHCVIIKSKHKGPPPWLAGGGHCTIVVDEVAHLASALRSASVCTYAIPHGVDCAA